MRDTYHHIDARAVIVPAANTDIGTTPLVGAVIDVLGFDSLTYVIQTGTLSDANATYTVLLEESDASDMSGANAVADADLIGTEAAASFTYAADSVVRKLGYIGNRRYTRLTVTPAGADSGNSPVSAVALLGHPASAPV